MILNVKCVASSSMLHTSRLKSFILNNYFYSDTYYCSSRATEAAPSKVSDQSWL